jgi:hypothetical protein
MELHKKYRWLVKPKVVPLPKDEGKQVGSLTSDEATPDYDWPESVNASMGTTTHMDATCPFPMDRPVPSYIRKCVPEIAHIAAVCDEIPRECKFCTAQHHTGMMGECPKTSRSNCCCMAALVNVNGLEAYTLLDTGSTTISVTHNFAQVAKLNIIQLENLIQLQLGMVGSHSMINFGTKTRLELGPVCEDNAYLDVINID